MCWWAIICECPTEDCGGTSHHKVKFILQGNKPECNISHCTEVSPCNTQHTPNIYPPTSTPQYMRLCGDCLANVAAVDKMLEKRKKYICKKCGRDFRSGPQCNEHIRLDCPRDLSKETLYDCMTVQIRDLLKGREFHVLHRLPWYARARNAAAAPNPPSLNQPGISHLGYSNPQPERRMPGPPHMLYQRPRLPELTEETSSTMTGARTNAPSESLASTQSYVSSSDRTAVHSEYSQGRQGTAPLSSSELRSRRAEDDND